MTGIFGVVSDENCIGGVFYGTDYHSHLGTEYGGVAYFDGKAIQNDVKRISLHPFRPQLSDFIKDVRTNMAIGVISDYEPQPLDIKSSLGNYAIAHVGKINNLDKLAEEIYRAGAHFSAEKVDGKPNPIEVIASLINQGKDYIDGIEIMQNSIQGSSSVMLLTPEGIIVARDKFGRTPIVIGNKKSGETAAASESCAFHNLGFEISNYLGPGEIGIITKKSYEKLKEPGKALQICSFLWIYYGFPATNYEGINTEITRNRFGEILAERDKENNLKLDFIAGIPDSGVGSAIGYMNASGMSYRRPYVKYGLTWQRSFMPQEQEDRDLVAKMKLILIPELVKGYKMLFTEDSIVRGTQLKKKIKELFYYGAREIHMRPSCSPLMYICQYLNFSRSKSIFDWLRERL